MGPEAPGWLFQPNDPRLPLNVVLMGPLSSVLPGIKMSERSVHGCSKENVQTDL